MIKNHIKWDIGEQANFLKRVGELLERGYPITDAIASISFQMRERKKLQLSNCLQMLREGYPFYNVLQFLKFHPTLIGYVYFAEQHGGMSVAFLEGSEMMLRRQKDKNELMKLLNYPIILISFTSILLVFVERLVLPRFMSLYESMGLESNVFTKVVYVFQKIMPITAGILLGTILFLFTYYFVFFRKLPAITQKNRLCSLPLIGEFYQLLFTQYFSIQLSYLLSGGLPILESLKLFEQNQSNSFDHQMGRLLREGLTKGENLEDLIKGYKCFDPGLAYIINHGQSNGRLSEELYFFSKYCVTVFQEKLHKVMKFIQPTIYTFIGLLIVSMYLAILLPMFHLMDGI